MKKWAFILTGIIALTACDDAEVLTANEEAEEAKIKTEPIEVSTTESTETLTTEPPKKVEVIESIEPEIEPEAEVNETTPLTLEDFNSRYELDTEFSEPFIGGKFELKDGSIVHADWYFYLAGETFDYASGVFIDGQLVHVQLDLKDSVTKEDVLTELGLSKEVIYDLAKTTNVADIVVDKRFVDGNIKRFPNEWD